MNSRASTRAFTLLEVMLAMSLLTVVAAIAYAAFHLGQRAVEHGEIAVVTTQRLRVASDTLIRQIKSTVAYPARNKDEDVYPYFVGSATSMTFVTATGLHGGGALTRVIYQVMDQPPRLVVSESEFFSPDALGRKRIEQVGEETAVLLDGFRTLKFEYMMNDGVDTEWHGSWDGHVEETLPAAVRIVVEGMPGMETDVWGQEIPIMATTYGENIGEVDEEDLAELSADTSDADEEDDESGGKKPHSRNWKPKQAPGEDEGDDE